MCPADLRGHEEPKRRSASSWDTRTSRRRSRKSAFSGLDSRSAVLLMLRFRTTAERQPIMDRSVGNGVNATAGYLQPLAFSANRQRERSQYVQTSCCSNSMNSSGVASVSCASEDRSAILVVTGHRSSRAGPPRTLPLCNERNSIQLQPMQFCVRGVDSDLECELPRRREPRLPR